MATSEYSDYILLTGTHTFQNEKGEWETIRAGKNGRRIRLTKAQAKSLGSRVRSRAQEIEMEALANEGEDGDLEDITEMSAKAAVTYISTLQNPTEDDIQTLLEAEQTGENRITVVKALQDLMAKGAHEKIFGTR